jgi:hypothetical protein
MARNGKQDVPLVVGLFLLVLAMMSIGNLGLSIANSRDIYKINAKINAIINNDSHVMIAEVTKRETADESAVFTRKEDNTSLELSPHPVYANVLMSKMVYPNKTSGGTFVRDWSSRWGLGLSKLEETGNAIRGLASNCRLRAGSDDAEGSRKLECLYGAISTLITMGRVDQATYARGAGIARVLTNWSSAEQKQKQSEPHDPGTIDFTLTEYQNFVVNISQSPMALMFEENANMITYNDTGLPILFGVNRKGEGMLVTYRPNPDNVSEATAIYGFVPPPSGLEKRTSNFKAEHFIVGGLEAEYAFNQNSYGGGLSENDDYDQMDHEVSHLFDDLMSSGYAWQIYDNDNGRTIAGGAITRLKHST